MGKKGNTKTASATDSNHIAPAADSELDVPSVDTRRDIFPISQDAAEPAFAPITSAMRASFLRETADGEKGTAYQTLRHTWATAHNVGRKFKSKDEGKGKKKGKKKWNGVSFLNHNPI